MTAYVGSCSSTAAYIEADVQVEEQQRLTAAARVVGDKRGSATTEPAGDQGPGKIPETETKRSGTPSPSRIFVKQKGPSHRIRLAQFLDKGTYCA